MSIPEARLRAARAVVLDVLSGRSTPESDPVRFEDDAVLFGVQIVEAAEPAWLLAQLGDQRYPLSGRIHVMNNLGRTLDQALELLRREDPSIPSPRLERA